MRIVVLGSLVASSAVSSGETMSCSGPLQGHETEITWTLPDGPGSSGVELLGCSDWDVELDEHSATLDDGWFSCAIRGWRQDGRLRVFSTPISIDGDERALHISFDLPSGPIGGMGAEFHPVGSSVLLRRVLAGTPADRMGLRPGDRVLSVDGMSTAHMSATQFIRVVTGRPSTVVELTVDDGESVRTVELVRERVQ